MKLISGNSNRPFADLVASLLRIELTRSEVRRFSDNEIFVEILENIRGQDIFIIQSTSYPANDHMMELLIIIDALKRASARRITAVIPYFGYARQDRKTGSRTPISAKLVANLITTAGADRVMTVDLHADQIQGFFDLPTDNLFCAPVFARDIKEKYGCENTTIISPDIGGVRRALLLANRLNLPIAIIDKRREAPGESKALNVIGEVKGKNCIIIDDIVDSGNTLCSATVALINAGAKNVSAYISHGVLPNNSSGKIEQSLLKELVITDSIKPRKHFSASSKIRTLSIAHLIAEAIKRTAENKSVSSLFTS